MKKTLVFVLLLILCLASPGLADINRQIWDTGSVNENLVGVRTFHEDKRPDMMPFDPAPDIEDVLAESWFGDRADNYYANLWGWVTIPKTGDYTWHIHGDNHSVLYVSTDASWENVEEVASIDGWSNIGEWGGGADGGNNADSAPINYTAGQQLAVWGIMVEGGGGDNLGIGWTMPGSSTVEYISDHVSIIPPAPTRTKNPIPGTDTSDVPRDADLGWDAGKFAAKHDVYFGSSYSDVNDAIGANPLGVLVAPGTTATTYDPGILAFDQTYYWRVDAVNSPPDSTIFGGDIWSFTVEPFAIPVENVTASASGANPGMGAENTVNGSGLNAMDQHGTDSLDMWLTGSAGAWIQYDFDKPYKLHELLVWNSNQAIEAFLGFGAKEVTVEYTADGENWIALEGPTILAQATGLPTYTANTAVALGGIMAQSVKLSVVSAHGFVGQSGLAEVRFMAVPVAPREPQPADGGSSDGAEVALSWRSGREAVSHEVSLGADADSLALIGTTSDTTTVTDALDYNTTYAWSVTEVNDAADPTAHAGDVWTFSTPEFGTVDDFESYSGNEGEEVFMTWFDGFGGDTSLGGSTTGHIDGPFVETAIVNSGNQSMPIYIDNDGGFYDIDGTMSSPNFSEVVREFDSALDLTASSVKTLSIMFAGSAGLTGQLYCKVGGTMVLYDSEAANLSSNAWQAWNIDLSNVGGNLKSVRELAIGVEGGTSGILYIDDIRLYTQIGEYVTPAEPTAELAAHYAFENNTNDSSGNNYHGAESGILGYEAGMVGQALSLDGIASYVSIESVGIGGAAPRTIAGWAKANSDTMADWTNVFGFTGPSTNGQHFDIEITGGTGTTTAGNFGLHRHGWEMDITANDQRWHHFAATFDGTTVSLYGDGLLVNAATVSNVDTPGPVHIGKREDNTNYFNGLVDDVRIYDTALSPEEIAWIAGKRTPTHKPF